MVDGYEEIIRAEVFNRRAPSGDHERLVTHLHQLVSDSLPLNSRLQLLPPRTDWVLSEETTIRPDLTIVRVTPGRGAQLYLVAEVLLAGDHHVDTVIKKELWPGLKLPRLWMVDPRYLNVEVYGCGEYGFTLVDILAHHHALTDPCLPGLRCTMNELFAQI